MFSKDLILPRETPGAWESGRPPPAASQESDRTRRLNHHPTAEGRSGLCFQLLGGNLCALDCPT